MRLLTPTDAYARSPACILDEAEGAAIEKAIANLNAFLVTGWNGTAIQCQIPSLTARAAAAFVRSCEASGWTTAMQPQDGAIGKAADLLRANAPCGFTATLTPRWERDAPIAPALQLNGAAHEPASA